jgi:hypothetical protein
VKSAAVTSTVLANYEKTMQLKYTEIALTEKYYENVRKILNFASLCC